MPAVNMYQTAALIVMKPALNHNALVVIDCQPRTIRRVNNARSTGTEQVIISRTILIVIALPQQTFYFAFRFAD